MGKELRMGVWAMMILLSLVCAGCASAKPWQSVDQPDLKASLDSASMLAPEELGAAARGVTTWTFMMVPNRDGKTWDALQWYFKGYGGPTWLYACDLGTGVVKKQRFPDGVQIHMCGECLAGDGKYYITTSGRGGMLLFVYDPDTNTLENRGVIVKDLGGEMRRTCLGPDGRIYGTGDYRRPQKAGAYSLDPLTGEVRDYGPIGPDHAPNGAFGYWIGVDDTHIYVASGKIPWYLVAINIKTGEEKILAKAPTGDYSNRMRIWPMSGGARAWVYDKGGDENNGECEGGTWYWLYHGEAIPMGDDVTLKNVTTKTPPWKPFVTPLEKAGPEPETYLGQVYPDAQGVAKVWFRSAADAAKAPANPPAGTKPEALGWKSIQLEGVETYPLNIHRLIALPDGRLFGTAQAYIGRFLYDPKSGVIPLGNGGPSWYALAVAGGKLYLSGYSNAPIDMFDPARPWTLLRPSPPGQPAPEEASLDSNPRRVADVFAETRVKKMYSAAVGADGKVYCGGGGIRDYNGGGFGWYDPKTNEKGGMWKPFSGYAIYWLSPAAKGRYIVISTEAVRDELNDNQVPESGKIFIYDTSTGRIVRDVAPVPKAEKAGPVLEVAPGRLLGMTNDPDATGGGILYGLNLDTGEVLFRRALPAVAPFKWASGTEQWDYVLGPDGNVWTYLGQNLVRIHPADGRIDVIGKLDKVGQMAFIGNDLYLAGTQQVRRLANVTAR